jgi:hypothetical protein
MGTKRALTFEAAFAVSLVLPLLIFFVVVNSSALVDTPISRDNNPPSALPLPLLFMFPFKNFSPPTLRFFGRAPEEGMIRVSNTRWPYTACMKRKPQKEQ